MILGAFITLEFFALENAIFFLEIINFEMKKAFMRYPNLNLKRSERIVRKESFMWSNLEFCLVRVNFFLITVFCLFLSKFICKEKKFIVFYKVSN